MNSTIVFSLNRILSTFDLEWDNVVGLSYIHRLQHGKVHFHITKDFSKVEKFLGLPFKPTEDLDALYTCLTQSKYFQKKRFLNADSPSEGFDYICREIRLDKPVDLYNPGNSVTIDKIDKAFGSNVRHKVNLLNSKGINKKELRNKFNGKLVMKWSGLKPGPMLAETIEEFKRYVEYTYSLGFIEYLNTRTPKTVRAVFIQFFHDFDYRLVDNTLPF